MHSDQNVSVGCGPVAAWRVEGVRESETAWKEMAMRMMS